MTPASCEIVASAVYDAFRVSLRLGDVVYTEFVPMYKNGEWAGYAELLAATERGMAMLAARERRMS